MSIGRVRATIGLLGVVAACAGPAVARADSLTLSVLPAAPTDATPLQIRATGDTAANANLYVVYRSSGTGPCAGIPGQPDGDPGAGFQPFGTAVAPGPFDVTGAPPQSLSIGSYLFCGYLVDGTDGTVLRTAGPASLTVNVTAADTVSIAQPADPVGGRSFELDAAGTAYDAGAVLDATVKRAGGACAATPGADTGKPTDSSGGSPATG